MDYLPGQFLICFYLGVGIPRLWLEREEGPSRCCCTKEKWWGPGGANCTEADGRKSDFPFLPETLLKWKKAPLGGRAGGRVFGLVQFLQCRRIWKWFPEVLEFLPSPCKLWNFLSPYRSLLRFWGQQGICNSLRRNCCDFSLVLFVKLTTYKGCIAYAFWAGRWSWGNGSGFACL